MELLPFKNGVSALTQDKYVGKLYGKLVSRGLFIVFGIDVCADDPLPAARKLLGWVEQTHPGCDILALSWDKKDDRPYEDILLGLHFSVEQEKAYYSRSLAEWKSPYEDPLTYRPLVEAGRNSLLQILGEVRAGDHGESPEIPVQESFQALFESMSQPFALRWRAAYLTNEIVGIVFPDIYPDEPSKGTIAYIGIRPRFRGRGLARILHARALSDLAALSATTYIGSTHMLNTAMRKVFESNGCTLTGIRRHWKRGRAGEYKV